MARNLSRVLWSLSPDGAGMDSGVEPDLTEAIKWNMLCFSANKLVVGLSACQRHLGLTFFRGAEVPDPTGLLQAGSPDAGIRTLRFRELNEVDQRALRALLRGAVQIDRTPKPPPVRGRRPPLPVPESLTQALRQDSAAAAGFAALSPSCQREYIAWVRSAKRPETLERRLAETLSAVRLGRRWVERKDLRPRPAPTRLRSRGR